ncbi:hypothetical protein CHS0354_009117 [Potamilus streckersoni]|uniref:Uncharacterized protein n=1 Tax=Potamilus streckersoni TaxID=2493646 RepID=A0AAE0SSC6_9BIVA|nr:hypothetical protein CHS0354_009117 [Potamilus streckersoni]
MIWLLDIIAMSVIASADNQLHNDTCASIKINNISVNTAEIVCDKDSKIFDPTLQNGVFLFDRSIDSWNKSEIFSCQCKCHLPKIPENGLILPESIQHGATFNYKCKEGFSQTINRSVTCYDGVLMLIPNYLADYNITNAFRQKSLDRLLTDDIQQEIFILSVNKTSNWTIPETEVRSNQKYIQRLSQNETVLVFYLFNGQGYKHGIVDLKTGLKPKCVKNVIRSSGTIDGISNWYLFSSICIYLLF